MSCIVRCSAAKLEILVLGNATTAIASMFRLAAEHECTKSMNCFHSRNSVSAISAEDETIVGIYLGLEQDIEGSMMFLMKLDSAHYLVNRLMGRDPDYKEDFTEMDLSAIKEIGNIIAGSYLSALSSMTNLTISPTIPYVAIDMAAAILSVPACMFGQYGDNALLIETQFGDEVMIEGYFILLPELDSYDKILSALGIAI